MAMYDYGISGGDFKKSAYVSKLNPKGVEFKENQPKKNPIIPASSSSPRASDISGIEELELPDVGPFLTDDDLADIRKYVPTQDQRERIGNFALNTFDTISECLA